MRLVCEFLSTITGTFSEVDGDSQSSGTRRNVDGCSTSKVESTLDGRPSVRVPRHTRERVVNNGRPNESEQERRTKTTAFRHSANSDDRAMRRVTRSDRPQSHIIPRNTYVMAANMHW